MPGIGIGISPYFQHGAAGLVPPPPPYIIAARGNSVVTEILGLDYEDGLGPSNPSVAFRVQASGLTPAAGNITMTPPADFEISANSGSSWTSTPILIAYTGGGVTTAQVYMVRLKAGLVIDSYSETLTLSGANAPDWNVTTEGDVSAGQYVVATGGTITRNGNHLVHRLTASDNFIVTQLASAPAYNIGMYDLVGGGGGGGSSSNAIGGAGAGGAGRYIRNNSYPFTVGTFPVVIGAGGPKGLMGTMSDGSTGGNSSFDGVIAPGGGYGSKQINFASNYNAGDGGSGGGPATTLAGTTRNPGSAIAGTGIAGQGNAGGVGDSSYAAGAAGGGAGGAGGSPTAITTGGVGGLGVTSNLTGSVVTYCTGGDAGSVPPVTPTTGVNNGDGGWSDYANDASGSNGSGGVFVITYYSPL